MLLLNPKNYSREHKDPRSKEIIEKTIAFFEEKGLEAIKADDQASQWHEDFFEFIKKEKVFSTFLTPEGLGDNARWDMWRISEFNEILGFYGLSYWYAWQVTILGLGPIWMSKNDKARRRARRRRAARATPPPRRRRRRSRCSSNRGTTASRRPACAACM